MGTDRALRAARTVWAVLAAGVLALFAAGLPPQHARFLRLTGPDPFSGSPAATLRRITAAGWTLEAYADAVLALDVVLAAGFVALAVIVVRHRGHTMWGLGFSLAMIAFGCTFSLLPEALAERQPALAVPVAAVTVLGLAGAVAALSLFPDGRPAARWLLVVPVGYTVWESLRQVPATADVLAPTSPVVALLIVAGVVGGQVARWRRGSPVEREQLRWAAAGIVAGLVGFAVLGYLVPAVAPGGTAAGSVGALLLTAGLFLSLLLVPAGLTVALVRSGLWGVDVAVNRAAVYGTLSLGVVAVYAVLVAFVGRLGPEAGLATTVGTSVVVSLALHPARVRVQRAVNRLMYGDRDDPHHALSVLGRRLGTALRPDEVLPAIAETVHACLHVPYARVTLDSAAGPHSSEVGEPVDDPVCVPLTDRGLRIGELCVAPRRGDALGRRDRAFLEEFARLAGPPVAAIRLTKDLQRSRRRLVTAREEERRRIRNDLHDDVGPVLAGIMLKASAVRRRLPGDSDLLPLVEDLRADAGRLVGDIRSLVRGLRPPVLDARGLVAALGEIGDGLREAGLSVEVRCAPEAGELSAALDTAVLRIAQEACTNVLKHAQATRCSLTVDVESDLLRMEIADDGVGLPTAAAPGVGLSSMAERAAELGGTCEVAPGPDGGTTVAVRIPILLGAE